MVEKNDYLSYFLNDLYDDEIINAKFHDFQNRLYNNIMKGKEYIQNNRIINGDIFDLKQDRNLNRKYNVSLDSYSLHLNFCLVPFYSESKFIDRYGFGKLLSATSILSDDGIFPSGIYFFINGAFIFNIRLVIMEDETIVIIPASNTSREFNLSHVEEVINGSEVGMWTIMIKPKSDYYFSYVARANLFTGTKIYIDKFSNFKKYNKPTKNNYWTMYISYDPESINLMTATNVSVKEDSHGEYFEVPEKFKEFIYDHINMIKCLIVNEADCTGCGFYEVSDETSPIFQIPYEKNPIPLRNIIVWEYDTETNRKIHPLETSATITYPNIYNFERMFEEAYFVELYDHSKRLVVDASMRSIVLLGNHDMENQYDLYIEWIEPMYDPSAFDTPIQDYMDCYGIEYMLKKLEGSAHPIVQNYVPIASGQFTSEDYFHSEFHGDYRSWRLNHFINLLKDNPKRYDEYFHRIYDKTKQFITRSYTYESHPHIYKRSIMTNRDQVKDADEVLVNFKESNAYVRFYDPNTNKKYCNLFINGELKPITHVTKFGHTLYIYFPASYIANHETIHIDVNLSYSPFEMESEIFYLGKGKEVFDFEDASFQRENCLSNLLITDYTTNKPVDMNEFSLELKVDLIRLKYDGLDRIDTISNLDTDVDLYDSLLRLFVPKGYDAFVLDRSDMHVDIPNIDNINHYSFKKFDLENLVIRRKESERRYRVSTTDFYQKWVLTLTDDMIKTSHIFYIEKTDHLMHITSGANLPHKFACYVNGRRVEYVEVKESDDNHYEVNVPCTIKTGDKIYLEYLGYTEYLMVSNTIESLKSSETTGTNEDIIYLDLKDYSALPFDLLNCKVYIDGLRISHDQIKIIEGNTIMIRPSYYKFTDASELMIFAQAHDVKTEGLNIVEYDFSSQYMSQVSRDDEIYRNYLIQKYK